MISKYIFIDTYNMIVLIVSKGYIPMNLTVDSRQSNTERI